MPVSSGLAQGGKDEPAAVVLDTGITCVVRISEGNLGYIGLLV